MAPSTAHVGPVPWGTGLWVLLPGPLGRCWCWAISDDASASALGTVRILRWRELAAWQLLCGKGTVRGTQCILLNTALVFSVPTAWTTFPQKEKPAGLTSALTPLSPRAWFLLI